MKNQMENSEKKLTTGRFRLPDNIISNIERMRIIGVDKPDLLVYTDRLDELTEAFAKIGFSKVDRKFQLHVSTNNEETFKKVFTVDNLSYDIRPSSNDRFIATVTVDTMEEYIKYLELDDQSNNCSIKPYKPRFASIKDKDDSSDSNDKPDHSDQYQRQPQQPNRKGGKGNYHSNDRPTSTGGSGSGGKGKGYGYGKGKGNRNLNNSQSNDI